MMPEFVSPPSMRMVWPEGVWMRMESPWPTSMKRT